MIKPFSPKDWPNHFGFDSTIRCSLFGRTASLLDVPESRLHVPCGVYVESAGDAKTPLGRKTVEVCLN